MSAEGNEVATLSQLKEISLGGGNSGLYSQNVVDAAKEHLFIKLSNATTQNIVFLDVRDQSGGYGMHQPWSIQIDKNTLNIVSIDAFANGSSGKMSLDVYKISPDFVRTKQTIDTGLTLSQLAGKYPVCCSYPTSDPNGLIWLALISSVNTANGVIGYSIIRYINNSFTFDNHTINIGLTNTGSCGLIYSMVYIDAINGWLGAYQANNTLYSLYVNVDGSSYTTKLSNVRNYSSDGYVFGNVFGEIVSTEIHTQYHKITKNSIEKFSGTSAQNKNFNYYREYGIKKDNSHSDYVMVNNQYVFPLEKYNSQSEFIIDNFPKNDISTLILDSGIYYGDNSENFAIKTSNESIEIPSVSGITTYNKNQFITLDNIYYQYGINLSVASYPTWDMDRKTVSLSRESFSII